MKTSIKTTPVHPKISIRNFPKGYVVRILKARWDRKHIFGDTVIFESITILLPTMSLCGKVEKLAGKRNKSICGSNSSKKKTISVIQWKKTTTIIR